MTTRHALIGAAVVGLIARLAFGLFYWVDKPLTRDEREYLSLARSLAAGRGFVYDADVAGAPQDPFGRAPGYPTFLVLAGGGRAEAHSVPAAVKAVQAGVDLVLDSPDPVAAFKAVRAAVEAGQIERESIDASVRRILEAKARLGLK